eukprot:4372706-Amphidinium_carterae.2
MDWVMESMLTVLPGTMASLTLQDLGQLSIQDELEKYSSPVSSFEAVVQWGEKLYLARIWAQLVKWVLLCSHNFSLKSMVSVDSVISTEGNRLYRELDLRGEMRFDWRLFLGQESWPKMRQQGKKNADQPDPYSSPMPPMLQRAREKMNSPKDKRRILLREVTLKELARHQGNPPVTSSILGSPERGTDVVPQVQQN